MNEVKLARKRRKKKNWYAEIDIRLEKAFETLELANFQRVTPDEKKKLKGLMRHYASKPHPFTSCVNDNTKRFGPERAKKVCAVLKDLIRGTTKWRGKESKASYMDAERLGETMNELLELAESVNADPEAIEMDLDVAAPEGGQEITPLGPATALVKVGDSAAVFTILEDDLLEIRSFNLATMHSGYPREIKMTDDTPALRDIYDTIRGNDLQLALSHDEGRQVLGEFFFESPAIELADGGIWKTILREGKWKVGPWSTPGKPVPMTVLEDEDVDPSKCEVSLKRLAKNFKAKAVEHVTVPETHKNSTMENLGFVRDVRIVKDESGSRLEGLIDFTSPVARAKAEEGSIANVSSGILFDFERKEDGKKFDQAIGHVCITNQPWVNGMEPFGANAAQDLGQDVEKYLVLSLEDEKIRTEEVTVRDRAENDSAETTDTLGGDRMADDQTVNLNIAELGYDDADDLRADLEAFRRTNQENRVLKVDAKVRRWEGEGVPPKVVLAARKFMLADDGAPSLLLSDDEGKNTNLSVSDIVEAIVSEVPRTPKPVERGEREASDHPENGDRKIDASRKAEITQMWLDGEIKGEDLDAALAGELDDKEGDS